MTAQTNSSTTSNNTKDTKAEPVKVEAKTNASKDDMKKKYSLADEFVKQYTSVDATKDLKKEEKADVKK